MKPSEKQIRIINKILFIIGSWRNSNDINSPTVNSDIYEELDIIPEEELNEMNKIFISDKLLELLNKIREL